jgi:SAM-dependent methyltransferase
MPRLVTTAALFSALLAAAPRAGGLQATAAGAGSLALQGAPNLAPFVATPMDVVDRMLTLAKVGPGDVVYDLGCGDGRVVIAAAQTFGARGVGVDIDADLIARAEARARAAGVEDRVTFRLQDALTVDVSDATVVTLYLLSASNVKLRPILTSQLRRGARIVSHNFPIGDWEPDVVDTFRDASDTPRTLYLWNFDGTFRP